jgi:hypothetical protein
MGKDQKYSYSKVGELLNDRKFRYNVHEKGMDGKLHVIILCLM